MGFDAFRADQPRFPGLEAEVCAVCSGLRSGVGERLASPMEIQMPEGLSSCFTLFTPKRPPTKVYTFESYNSKIGNGY